MGIFFNGRFRRGQALAAQDGIIEKLNKVLDILENIRGEDGVRIDKNPIDGITVGLNSGEIDAPSGSGGGSSGVYVTGVSTGSNDWELSVSYSNGTTAAVSVPHPTLVTSVTWNSSQHRIDVTDTANVGSAITFVSYSY